VVSACRHAQTDDPHIVEIASPICVINHRNLSYVNQDLKEFLANHRMALAWFFRSLEQGAWEAAEQHSRLAIPVPLSFA
jgi:hypothetical protein